MKNGFYAKIIFKEILKIIILMFCYSSYVFNYIIIIVTAFYSRKIAQAG